MRKLIFVTAVFAGVLARGAVARATPSTQVWIPSPDVQGFLVPHLNYDVYARPGKATVLMFGPTVGVLPWKKLQAEVGFDLMFVGNSDLDKYPLYLHGKIAAPEDVAFNGAPSLALGIYNAGVRPGVTTQNIGYALMGRKLPMVGRVSGGYYLGNEVVLLDENGEFANRGLMLAWDRTMSEISDRLWLGLDYQGGRSAMSAFSGGVAWAFTQQISMIFGYDHYMNEAVAGKDTFTLQLDINL